jgi:ATP-dependent Lon protease
MNVFQIEAPDAEASRKIASRMYQQIRSEHGWGSFFELEPGEDALDALIDLAPREMRRAWMTGFGNARLRGSDQVKAADLPAQTPLRRRVGFLA